jgi:hypothetical protein
MPETRFYPMACQSLYCGETVCSASCPELPALEAFKAWRDRTNATRPDPIWSPTAYRAQR